MTRWAYKRMEGKERNERHHSVSRILFRAKGEGVPTKLSDLSRGKGNTEMDSSAASKLSKEKSETNESLGKVFTAKRKQGTTCDSLALAFSAKSSNKKGKGSDGSIKSSKRQRY